MTQTLRVSRKLLYLLFSLALILISITYSNHFHNQFHFDDAHVAQNNIYIRSLENIPRFFQDATLSSSFPENQHYRPLVSTTLALDYAVEKDITRPFWFHVSMFAWFLVQCVFLFFFLCKIADRTIESPWNPFFALFGMTLYGVHTVNAETINYISARSDSMSTCWIIIALVTFVGWPRLRKWGLCLIPWFIACLFKQTAIVFPALAFLYVLLFEKQQALSTLFQPSTAKQTWLALLRSTGLLWGFGLALFYFIQSMEPPSYNPGGTSVYQYMITQPFVMVHYFFTFFLPLQLSADTDWSTLASAIDDRFFVGVLFILGALSVAFFTSKKQRTRPIAFGLLWFFIALLPVSSVIPLAEVMNDHRLFFPLIGLVITFCFIPYSFLLDKLQQQKNESLIPLTVLSICLILSAFSYGTYQRNKVWSTEETLWKDVTLKSPKNGRGLMSYGLALMSRGDLVQAKKYFLEAKKLTPYYFTLMINLGIVNDALGLNKEADAYFEKALKYRPDAPDVYIYYADHHRAEQPALAEQALNKVLSLSPGSIDAHHRLMQLYWEEENWSKLSQAVETALRLVPEDTLVKKYKYYADHRLDLISEALEKTHMPRSPDSLITLSNAFFEQRQYLAALKASEKALLLDPQLAIAYNNICAIHNKFRQYEKAKIACQKAISIDPNLDVVKNNLTKSLIYLKYGDAISQTTFLTHKAKLMPSLEVYIELSAQYYAQKNYDKAIKISKKAIALNPKSAIPYNNICAAYNQLHDFQRAEVACRKALELQPNFDMAKNNLEVSINGQHS